MWKTLRAEKGKTEEEEDDVNAADNREGGEDGVEKIVETFKIDENVHVRITRVPISAHTVRHTFITLIYASTYARRRQGVHVRRAHNISHVPNRNATPRSIHSFTRGSPIPINRPAS